MEISKNLKEAGFIVIQKGNKTPFVEKGEDWNNHILNYGQANQKLKEGYNIALVNGVNNFFTGEADSLELSQAFEGLLPATYCEESISSYEGFTGRHYIFRMENSSKMENFTIKWQNRHLGELRMQREFVVIAPSIALNKQNQIKQYKILSEVENIPFVTKEQVLNVLNQFKGQSTGIKSHLDKEILGKLNSDSEITKLLNGDITGFVSRSEAELSLVCKLVSRNFDKETIFQIMANSKTDKWNEKPLSYRNLTYEKAVKKVTQEKAGWENEEVELLNVMTLEDYENHKVNKDYIIQGRMFPKETEMRYAPSGKFKSLYSLYEGICIASGRKVLDKFKVKKKPVLFISAENNIDTDKMFIKKIRRGLKLRKMNIPFYVLPRQECSDIMGSSFQKQLCKTIKRYNIKVIYLDTINPLTPELDDNSAKDVTRVFNNFLKPLNDDFGCTNCFLHHTTKTETSFLGSMKWKANADCITRFERKDLDCKFKIFNEKNRRGESNTLEVEINFDDVNNQITFKLLSEGKPAIFSNKKKMTQAEFFELKLNELVKDKKTERAEIFKIFEENGIKFSKGTLDRAIGLWRT